MARIVLISGKAEHGKTTIAKIIKNYFESKNFRVTFTPFASYLKFIAKEHYGWNGIKDSAGRTLLQHIGTDVIRKKKTNFWVNAMINFIDAFEDEFDVFIADDVRFENEILSMEESEHPVYTIRVHRKNFENSLDKTQRNHLSETGLDDFPNFDLHVSSVSGIGRLEESLWDSISVGKNWAYSKSFFQLEEKQNV